MNLQTTRIALAAALAFALASPVAAAQTQVAPPADDTRQTLAADTRDPGVPHPAPVHAELAGVFEQDFGGMPGMIALMDDFMVVMMEDPRMRPFFENTDRERVKRQLAEQFCAVLGGGCTYTGRDMKATHAAFRIDRADFNALVEDLQIAMNGRGIPFRSQNKLLAVLAPMHPEVITR